MRVTIGGKLNTLIVSLQLLSIGGVIILATQLFSSDLTGLLKKDTLDVSSMLANRVRAEMAHVADRARMLGAASLQDFQSNADRVKYIEDNLALDPQALALSLYRKSAEPPYAFQPVWRIVNPKSAKNLSLQSADFDALDRKFPLRFDLAEKGTVDFTVARIETPQGATASLRMALPFIQRSDGSFSQILVIELDQDHLSGVFSDSIAYSSFLVDRNGHVLGSTDPSKIPLGQDLSQLPIVSRLAADKNSSGQPQPYPDPSGALQIGAFHRIGFADLTVVSQIPLACAELAQKQLLRRTGFLAATFLFLALCLGFAFSKSLTGPIKALATAASRVAQGDFAVRLSSRAKGGDEIQQFSHTFNEMVAGLEERDKVKATFAKFHSKDVADKLMSGEVKLGGERKHAVVFFSDVRGFTAMSEKMDPEALVGVLNRYMTRMVRVILEHGGIVDKYVGDAIMAIWGAPMSKEDDADRALRACLGMRRALAELNEELKAEGLPALKIGMGLNYGPLIAGNIGSNERMEYTVIGDSVNTASRIESLTKEFGTDCLVSQEVLNRLTTKFVVEKAHEARVKGKSEPLVVYKLLGFVEADGTEVRVETEYSSYAAEKSDKVVHDKPEAKTEPGPEPAPEKWFATDGARELGPFTTEELARMLYVQELDFDCECWSEGSDLRMPIRLAGIFSGSEEENASLWVYDGQTIHGPLGAGFVKTAFERGVFPEQAFVCEELTIHGWKTLAERFALATQAPVPGPEPETHTGLTLEVAAVAEVPEQLRTEPPQAAAVEAPEVLEQAPLAISAQAVFVAVAQPPSAVPTPPPFRGPSERIEPVAEPAPETLSDAAAETAPDSDTIALPTLEFKAEAEKKAA